MSTDWVNQMFLYRTSYSAVLCTVRSSSVCQDPGLANSTAICMFPWYILGWLSNLELLTRTGKSCNGTRRMKSICFVVKTWCAANAICINCKALSVTRSLSDSRTHGASGWPRWYCTCSYEKPSPAEHPRAQTWPLLLSHTHHTHAPRYFYWQNQECLLTRLQLLVLFNAGLV